MVLQSLVAVEWVVLAGLAAVLVGLRSVSGSSGCSSPPDSWLELAG